MQRRSVIAGFAVSLIAPEESLAQQASAKIPRVGILTQASSDQAPMFDAFREGLRNLGYVEGRNIILEFRFSRGDHTRGPQLAAELVALPVDVIVVEGLSAAIDLNRTVLVVAPVMVDPVKSGRAANLARPGRNITGFTLMTTELNGKRVELLHDAFPAITTVAVLVNPANPSNKSAFAQTETAAGRWVWGMSAGSRPRA